MPEEEMPREETVEEITTVRGALVAACRDMVKALELADAKDKPKENTITPGQRSIIIERVLKLRLQIIEIDKASRSNTDEEEIDRLNDLLFDLETKLHARSVELERANLYVADMKETIAGYRSLP